MLDFGPDDDGVVARLRAGLDRWEELREDPPAAVRVMAVLVLLGVVGVVAWRTLRPPAPTVDVAEHIPIVGLDVTTTAAVPEPVVVHVVGAVVTPGLYELTTADRVGDAIAAAGGATGDAALASLNLAATLVDGSQIRVAVVGEAVTEGPAVTVGPRAGAAEIGGVVDLNRAGATELESLPGVGPATAAKIVAWREDSGPFRTVDDLLSVPGIGPAKLEALRDRVVVS